MSSDAYILSGRRIPLLGSHNSAAGLALGNGTMSRERSAGLRQQERPKRGQLGGGHDVQA